MNGGLGAKLTSCYCNAACVENGVLAKYKSASFAQWVQTRTGNVELIEIWPKPPPMGIPAYLPDNIERYYRQGMDSLNRRNFDASGTMFRKTLDIGVKRLHPSGKGTLRSRIDDLPDAAGITPAMREWAHQIRHLGNDAAHDEEPFAEDEARTLQSFTELFLTYSFSLPGMLSARRSELEASKQAPQS